jgi:pyruvate kinase
MNVARLNFSHGDHDSHRATYARVREAADELGVTVAILMDLQGPKIRTGKLAGGGTVTLATGEKVVVTTDAVDGTVERLSTTYSALTSDVKPGDRILLADGIIELLAERVEGNDVHCAISAGGILGEKKGINLPGVNVSAPSLTEKDQEDLALALELGADFVALSFVRHTSDITDIKSRIATAGKDVRVIAKIERPEALQHLDGIIRESDAVMVARGDLGVEVDLHAVPQIQKTLIRTCNEQGVPVITATQMLESMILHSRPTRAEAADVANAIYDGTDAIMLSGETASGNHPIRAVEIMDDIATNADEAIAAAPSTDIYVRMREGGTRAGSFSNAIGQAACRMAEVRTIERIVCLTKSDYTARAISRYRPRTKITAITLSESARRRCALIWGVDALESVEVCDTDHMVELVDRLLLEAGQARSGDVVAIVAGTPLGRGGRTNMLRLHIMGETETV